MTNFERITESPEKLRDYIRQFSCNVCPYNAKGYECFQTSKRCDELVLDWLQEECHG